MPRIDMDYGYLLYGGNELTVVSTVSDPPKVRLAATAGGSLGGVTFSRMRPDGVQEEMVIIQGKQDERVRSDPTNYSGELTIHIRHWQPGVGDDAQMVEVLKLRHDEVYVRGVRVA